MLEHCLCSTLHLSPGHQLRPVEPEAMMTRLPDAPAGKCQHFCLRDDSNRIIALFDARRMACGYFGYHRYHPDGTHLLHRLFRMKQPVEYEFPV